MSSYLGRLNPIPGFPGYSGPHKVGTVDVEIPISELPAPCPVPDGAQDIHTILFRIFYPTSSEAKGKEITWLPNPQRQYLMGYGFFMGASPLLSSLASFVPRYLHYVTIPAIRNAPLISPAAKNGRWPTMIFSHGLAGSRNSYSQLAGSLASHGVVVICPEYRDGSAIATVVRDPVALSKYQGGLFAQRPRSAEVVYKNLPHTPSREISEARDAQLRVRAWETGLLYEALVKMDEGKAESMTNLNTSTPAEALSCFANRLDVQEPGKVIWAGHSFGAATITQVVKSTYYADLPEVKSIANPIFAVKESAKIRRQITNQSVAVLLDMWCLPMISPDQTALYKLPLPCYDTTAPNSPGGDALLAVESDAFFKWTEHLHTKAMILSPSPSGAPPVSASAFDKPGFSRPSWFYVKESAHMSQSDFATLFPWLVRRVFNGHAPERVMRLNLRAVLQTLRRNGHSVAPTCAADLGDGDEPTVAKATATGGLEDDPAILDSKVAESKAIDAWTHIDVVGLGLKSAVAGTKTQQTDEK
ncbi:hypothetical protein PpBr36_04563 [Pyricularia pennisetigena]|uniref:hypothetical protein n=1 Tax=Pyricularia pennisetigena TaxID=1578925 RepID=UPI001154F83B|nr:hypothetical protein PpBr36_04563 [Pyricularia pennisetigena]TLS26339.1 hypothetical protein PpBr36_04563 [Pyricularia pennisetigena]